MTWKLAVGILAGICCAAAQTNPADSTPKRVIRPVTPRQASRTPNERITIPPNSQRIDEAHYRYVDGDGKAWIYVKTPFGIVKNEETPSTSGPASSSRLRGEKIPANATRIDDNHYRWVDAGGATWIYANTPFGVVKSREGDDPAPLSNSKAAPVRYTIHGDEVHFEQDTAFGKNVWTKKKSNLTDEEKKIMGTPTTESKSRQ